MTARRLDDLLRGIATPADGGIVVTGLTQDSHAVRTGDAFVALAGAKHHGIEFVGAAVARGAVVVLAEKQGPGTGDRGPGKPASLSSVPLSQTVAAGASAHGNHTNPVDAAFGPRSPVPGPAPSSSAGLRSPVAGPALSSSAGPRSPVAGPALSSSAGPRSPVAGPALSSSAGPRAPVASPVIWIENLRTHLGAIAARFYDDPSAALTVIGVTGTSGKTSTVQMLAQAFTHLGRRAATIGTLGAGLHGLLRAGEHTTPDVIRVHGLLAEFRDAGATGVAMEVSSHALDQHRVDGVHFDVAVFTNLTRDHLDYHGTMEAYGAAKARLFAWPDLRAAVINVDDAFGRTLAANLENNPRHPGQGMTGTRIQGRKEHHGLTGRSTGRSQGRKQQILLYGIDSADADIRATDVQLHSDGIDFVLATPWGAGAVHSRLLGRFNVANLLAVAGVLGALEVPFDAIRGSLEALEPIAGRMNRLGGGAAPLVVVDYSHKPDPLEQVLATLRAHCEGKLICVFGCGGERDAGKRPVMGAIAERLADVVIVTDDNPRGEDGDAIVAQIVAGMEMPGRATIERDRARAIGIAIGQARAGDVILIAGKGHETYQETAGVKRPFDDLEVARSTLESGPC